MTPKDLHLPIPAWRPGQLDLIDHITSLFLSHEPADENEDPTIVAACLPTGYGKSIIAKAVGELLHLGGVLADNEKVVILTKTKGLQDQYTESMQGLGLADIRGKDNYPCARFKGFSCSEAWAICKSNNSSGIMPNQPGSLCSSYRKAIADAAEIDNRTIVTNYSYWIKTREPQWKVGLLVCDEAHEAAEVLCDSMSAEITLGLWQGLFGDKVGGQLAGPDTDNQDKAYAWWMDRYTDLGKLKERLQSKATSQLTPADGRKLATCENLMSSIEGIGVGEDWVYTAGEEWRTKELWAKASPVWAGKYRGQLLKDVKRVLEMSATLRQAQLGHQGIKRNQVSFIDKPIMFPKQRAPIYLHLGAPRMSGKADHHDKLRQVYLIDNILRKRMVLGWHGLIQTNSYEQAEFFLKHSEFNNICMSHARNAKSVAKVVEDYSRVPVGQAVLLVSPVVGTGYDFKDDLCRINIITKIPFLETKNPLVKARVKRDPSYSNAVTMQTLVQRVGRLQRTPEDWGETWIVDGQGRWFLPQINMGGSNRGLVPVGWEVIPVSSIPEPLDIG